MRPKSACVVCRQRRKRCIRTFQGTSCDFCIEKHMQCIVSQETEFSEDGYEPMIPRHIHLVTHKFKLLPPIDLCEELIELYFRYVHVSFHVLFHHPSFVRAFRNGSLPRVLLLAVLGLSARFSKHEQFVGTDPRERGRPFTQEAERLLNLHDISLTSIQACLLLGASAVIEGDGSTESIYFSIACRMGMLLDLPNAPVMTRIQQEINHRVSWALYETDTWSSTATRLPKMMPLRDVPLPMAEQAFRELSPAALPLPIHVATHPMKAPITSTPGDSLIAYSVVVNQIFPSIDRINSQAVSGEIPGPELVTAVGKVAAQLTAWETNLPSNIVNSAENLSYWTAQGLGHMFVVLHMNYYHLGQLLFYQFLDSGLRHTPDQDVMAEHARTCARYATNLCNLIHSASDIPDAELLNSIVGHVLTIASTVQLHRLLFSAQETDVQNARRLLERNFEILTRLKVYWPCIDISFARFNTFHKACLRSQDDSLFHMDRWMLQFILEFATVLTQRYDEETDDADFERSFLVA